MSITMIKTFYHFLNGFDIMETLKKGFKKENRVQNSPT